jgi:hypothetical protein
MKIPPLMGNKLWVSSADQQSHDHAITESHRLCPMGAPTSEMDSMPLSRGQDDQQRLYL